MADSPGSWTRHWTLVPESRRELWEFIGNAAFGLGPQARVVWRGLPDSTYAVKSSLVRDLERRGIPLKEETLRRREMEILDVARDWDIGLSEHGTVSDLHLLAMLQHHGAPTRLIDVTYNPLTALWFACSDEEKKDEPGLLVVMTVTDTHKHTTSEHASLTFDTLDVPGAATLVTVLRQSRATGNAFILDPRPKDARMKAQEGAFIGSYWPSEPAVGPVVGLPYSSLAAALGYALKGETDESMMVNGDSWNSFGLAGILISPELKRELLPVLDHTFNRSHRTMYPDVPGFVGAFRDNLLDARMSAFSPTREDGRPRWPEYWKDES